MRKLVLMLILVSIGFVYAQEDWYVTVNDEHANDVTADAIIFSEPIAVGLIVTTSETASDQTPEQDMAVSVEATYSEFTKKLNIPLWYRWKDFSFNALVPYILAKGDNNSDDTVSGLGDLTLGFGYGKYLPEQNLYIDFNLSSLLPTGQEDVEADNGATFDLTSKTLDFSVAASGYYFMDDFTFKSSLLYKINGEFENKGFSYWNGTETIVDPTVNKGDLFIFTAGADYRWQYRLVFGLGVLYGNHFASKT